MTQRNPDGTFAEGSSGNPKGFQGGVMMVRKIARQWTAEAIEALVEIMQDKAARETARVAAANSILDRAWGKPTVMIAEDPEHKNDDLAAIRAALVAQLVAKPK